MGSLHAAPRTRILTFDPESLRYFRAQKWSAILAEDVNDVDLDLVVALEATDATSHQQLTLYIPDKDRFGKEIGTQRAWVLEAARLLARIGGGVTIMPPVEGGWFDAENDIVIWERPVLVYTFVKTDSLLALLGELRDFVHRLGRQTKQGEVLVDLDGTVVRITKFREDA